MGFQKDVLDNKDKNYSLALSCFYITYIVLSIPGTLFAKAMNPSRTIAFGALTWSIAAACMAATKNPAGVYVCRLFIGVGEAFFGQAMALLVRIKLSGRHGGVVKTVFWQIDQTTRRRFEVFRLGHFPHPAIS